MKLYNINHILEILQNTVQFIGNNTIQFANFCAIDQAEANDISWLREGNPLEDYLINNTKASVIVCSHNSYLLYKGNIEEKLFVISETPKLSFVALLKKLLPMQKRESYIHPTAIISPDCKIGKNVSIGAYSIIDSCMIGDNCIIGDYVRIYENVKIGANCNIREYCSIGGQGFSYEKLHSNEWEHVPHIGNVVIEDNVDIFPFSNIDRGTFGSTVISSGTKIDHYVHIGHNSKIGKNNMITAQVVTSGGTQIGDDNFIGVNSLFKEGTSIGNNNIIGVGSVVVKNISDSDVVAGVPAKSVKKV